MFRLAAALGAALLVTACSGAPANEVPQIPLVFDVEMIKIDS